MKVYFLFFALLALPADARISLEELINAQNEEVGGEGIYIHPKGPLNMLRGYMYAELGYMHNKRFFSPEIETKYSLAFSENRYVYSRNASHDKAYIPDEAAIGHAFESAEYVQQYHSTLIKMFPSTNGGSLSIVAGRNDTFFNALESFKPKEANYLLAALLLLSEGVDVPIEETQHSIILFKTKKSMQQYAQKDAKPNIADCAVFEIDSEKNSSVSTKGTAQIVKFFKKYTGRDKLPDAEEEFKTGGFLNSPQFLIQAYLFEYVKSAEQVTKIARCAHTILRNLSPACDIDDIYAACFLPAEKKTEEETCLAPLLNLQDILKELSWFPFNNPSTLPAYTSVRACQKDRPELLGESFSNCVEAGLLALFCCLAYDPDANAYKISRMLGERAECNKAKALKAFFENRHAVPGKCATLEAMQEWNRVVSGLTCSHIAYCRKSQNELRSGLLSVLCVVAEVTGHLDAHQETLDAFMRRAKSEKESEKELFLEVQNYARGLLKGLSVNNQLEIEFSSMRKGERSDNCPEIFTELSLKYTHKGCQVEQGLNIELVSRHMQVSLLPACTWLLKKQMDTENMADQAPASFFGCLLSAYIDKWLPKEMMTDSSDELESEENGEKALVLRTLENINSLFLVGRPIDIFYKKCVASGLLLCAKARGIALAKAHPVVRLISNILGSIPLDDHSTQEDFLTLPVCTCSLKELFPNIMLEKTTSSKLFDSLFRVLEVNIYASEDSTGDVDTVMEYFKAYKAQTSTPLFKCYMLSTAEGVAWASIFLFKENTLCKAEEFTALLLDVDEADKKQAAVFKDTVCLFWFVCALIKKEPISSHLAPELYSRVCLDRIETPASVKLKLFVYLESKEKAIKGVEELKDLLVSMDGEEKYAKLLGLLQEMKPECRQISA
ncbi:uncharacterized protein NEMAJ01_0245 [Nematocida major]|uniref:uncharacterized protein n=1 Tax=Nematocida major TaxID=1912982 RepID=UPI002008C007|nr:uncharacterized protein NEMAJ01_0245 [Nematocida major]KAH9385349.1 hypothetical protein NEMAJ01_0245 [Nematocida major]